MVRERGLFARRDHGFRYFEYRSQPGYQAGRTGTLRMGELASHDHHGRNLQEGETVCEKTLLNSKYFHTEAERSTLSFATVVGPMSKNWPSSGHRLAGLGQMTPYDRHLPNRSSFVYRYNS